MTDISPNNGTATLAVGPDQARVELSTWLRHERERSGLSIEAVSQETRISKTYILSLESGKLESLPGKVFGRGFVKNITRLLKTDTSEGLRLYDACWGAPISPVTETKNDGGASTEVHGPRTNNQQNQHFPDILSTHLTRQDVILLHRPTPKHQKYLSDHSISAHKISSSC